MGKSFGLKLSLLALALVCAVWLLPGGAASRAAQATAQPARKIDFNRDIRPILSDKCFACHGPDATAKKIKLRLDSEEAAKADLGRGRRAILPGDAEHSGLVKRITSKDEAIQMPPASSGRALTPAEIELLTEWVKQGAPWQKHWALIPPARPALPEVKNRVWPRNEIDYFVLARLEQAGLQPSPEADRATLIRRLSLDLAGLPPTPQEIDAFLNDPAPHAYEKIVDRLLASPRYGERMAFKWLDAARYADTNGYQNDADRTMWRWRDWVINAFNANMPYDRFTLEQLAGDLLPNPTLDQRIATAFNRNHRQNSEDGLVPEEYAVEYVVDRVDTTATVFLGLTMGCARCHTHKYDPIQHREYYQLYAYFNSIREDGRSSYHNSPPFIPAPTVAQQQQLNQLNAELAQALRKLEALADPRGQRRWERELAVRQGNKESGRQGERETSAQASKWLLGERRPHSERRTQNSEDQWFPTDRLLLRHSLREGAKAEFVEPEEKRKFAGYDDEIVANAPARPAETAWRGGTPAFVAAPTGEGAAFDGKLFFDAGRVGNFDYSDRLIEHRDAFAVSIWFYAESEDGGALVTRMQDKLEEKDGRLPKNKGYGLWLLDGKLHWNVVSVWADDSWRVETEAPVATKQWHHVVAIFDGMQPYERAEIYLDGQKQKLKLNNGRIFRTFSNVNANLRIAAGAGPDYRFKGKLAEARLYQSRLDAEQIAVLACAESLAQIASLPPAQRTEGQRLKLRNAWLDRHAPPAAHAVWERVRELRRARVKLERDFPLVMVMEELPQPRSAHILRRGAYDLPGEAVQRGLPAALQTQATGPQPKDRLELARWLVGAENPLTARVTVNRFWQLFFGTGLVKTAEDFGVQGELPSHPELLDWLAVEFRAGESERARERESDRHGNKGPSGKRNENSQLGTRNASAWDVKGLLKTIVMSATYRQSSAVNPQSAIRNPQSSDPDNRLLARGARFRLPAEMIRDGALAISGLLTEKLGGPSVKPYQPAGLLKDMTFPNMTNYDQAKGEDLWRRSLYTYWKRTVLNPTMAVFDATAREQCTVRDTRTNTPLQALNLMNDVTYVEAARMLAERMIKEGGATPRARLAWAFRVATARVPDEREQQVLLDNFTEQLRHFRAHPAEAEKLLRIGERRNDPKLDVAELAAGATTASLILNLDEVMTRQ